MLGSKAVEKQNFEKERMVLNIYHEKCKGVLMVALGNACCTGTLWPLYFVIQYGAGYNQPNPTKRTFNFMYIYNYSNMKNKHRHRHMFGGWRLYNACLQS